MDTLKTAVVVVLLLAVLYGVYVILNKPTEQAPLPEAIAWHEQQAMSPLEVDLGSFDQASSPAPGRAAPSPPAWLGGPAESEAESAMLPADGPPPGSATVTAPDLLSSPEPTFESAPPLAPPPESPYARSPAAPDADGPASPLAANGPLDLAGPQPPVGTPSFATEPPRAARGGEFPVTSPYTPDSDTGPGDPISGYSPYGNALQSALGKIEDENWHDALWTLSLFFDSPDLTAEQHQQLLDWLDPLAAKVVYSRHHLIEPAHEVQRGERLAEIAERYQVPWQLLARINGIENPDLLVAGTRLKVVNGPFHAYVNLSRSELTLFVNRLYAGRFDITVGSDPQPRPGDYQVLDKQPGRTYYYSGDGRTIPAGDPQNPFGQVWIDLGSDVCIHGSAQTGPTASGLGCISLSPIDARDVSGILSLGSRVTITR